jgi:hypothetical protein
VNRTEVALERSERERADQGRRIYNLRVEIGELVRQVKQLQNDDRTKTDLRKAVAGVNKTLRSERYIHREQLHRIRQALCCDTDCECCTGVLAELGKAGEPFRSEEGT